MGPFIKTLMESDGYSILFIDITHWLHQQPVNLYHLQ